ncbi:MAG: hypothetical protein MJZ79_07415 [Paludibacteraceae bacterium]|nr:hypothetical protein [Paludibacteraceae bacterium]
MQKYIFVFITIVFTFPLWGSTIGSFSVSPTTKVTFAPGNLQYQASTNTWRFAEHQYDYVGDATQGNVYANGTKCDNTQISATYDGWIDLFGWGTSGFNSKYPYMTSVTNSDYVNGTIDITHTPYDWGVYNQLGIDPKGTWRTLTKDEWVYLCNTRPDASNLVGLATVNEVNGLIILPDNWALPSGLSFNALLDFNENIYTPEQWEKMEAAGACFLPAAGYRNSTNVFKVQEYGSYWSSSHKNSDKAYNLDFSNSALDPQYSYIRIDGQSVRLVHQLAEEGNTDIFLPYDATSLTPEQAAANPIHLAYPTAMQDKMPTIQCGEVKTEGVFSVSATTKVAFSSGNLQYQASTNTWRFAEHQYDYVGDATQGNVYANGTKCDNAQISATYDGWIDLFGWGTSGYNDKYPYMTSPTATDYGDGDKDIAGTNYDWGVYNQIGDYSKGTWRTLTKDEWVYLYELRPHASELYGLATVNEVTGLIVLPDNWEIPSGLSFTAGMGSGFSTNTYTQEQWAQMETSGACFLPTTGIRFYTGTVQVLISGGFYWASTYNESACAYRHTFDDYQFYSATWGSLCAGASVRLVRTIQK